jgi:GAF domain-containing protein
MTAPRTDSAASDAAARAILIDGARLIAHGSDPTEGLRDLVATISEGAGAESAAIVIRDPGTGTLEIAATHGLDPAAIAGLRAACQNPDHPIAKTFANPAPTVDVLPTRPGGPALRSHVPLSVARDGEELVLGVLALAHARPLDPEIRSVVLAAADLLAVAIERFGPT